MTTQRSIDSQDAASHHMDKQEDESKQQPQKHEMIRDGTSALVEKCMEFLDRDNNSNKSNTAKSSNEINNNSFLASGIETSTPIMALPKSTVESGNKRADTATSMDSMSTTTTTTTTTITTQPNPQVMDRNDVGNAVMLSQPHHHPDASADKGSGGDGDDCCDCGDCDCGDCTIL